MSALTNWFFLKLGGVFQSTDRRSLYSFWKKPYTVYLLSLRIYLVDILHISEGLVTKIMVVSEERDFSRVPTSKEM